jgi:hypothetical protein
LAGCISPTIERTKAQVLGEKFEMATKLVYCSLRYTREKDELLDLHQEVFVRGGLHQGIEKDFNCHVNRWQQQSNKAAMVRLCPQEAAAAGAAPSLALTKIGDVSSA